MLEKQLALLTTAAAALAAGIYVFWGPGTNRRQRRKDVCPGLENLGNSCFLNSVLQALAPCSYVVDWLTTFLDKQDNDASNDCLANTIIKTLQVLNNKTDYEGSTYSPVDVIRALRARHWVISPDEQDAHELFNVLTQTLDEETTKYPSVISLFDLSSLQSPVNKYQPVAEAVTRSKGLLPVLPHKEMEHPFRGLLASQLQCVDCGYKFPVRYDLFDSLSLSLPNSMWGVTNLDSLLKHFVTAETVSNVECPGCAKVDGIEISDGRPLPRKTFRKRLTIGKLPQCLCIHIKRTQWLNNGLPMKRFEHISFPEVLHMDEYVYSAADKSLTARHGLLGGKEQFFLGHTHSDSGMKRTTSGPVNLLRALNYDNRTTMTGIFLQPPNPLTVSNGHSDVNHNGPELPKYLQSEYTYKLTAAIQHLGDVFSGHFVTYRRSPLVPSGDAYSDRWLYASDTTVKKVSLHDVLSMEAYMLFYERV